jgi:hypothetical protein
MAKRRNSRKMQKIEPSQTSLTFTMGESGSTKWIDLAEVTSIVDRRLNRQGRQYVVSGFTVYAPGLDPTAAGQQVTISLSTIPNTWPAHNAWVKSRALWEEMRDLVLDDNPSVAGKWADFKVFMDSDHAKATYDAATGKWSTNLYPEDVSATVAKLTGRDWEYAQIVMPQHDVDAATGLPDVALQMNLHMLGGDVTAAQSHIDGSFAMIEGYENSRAQVQVAPDVSPLMSSSWMTLLNDKGSQEPELSDVIEDENDTPPYDIYNMPGSSGNLAKPLIASVASASGQNPVVHGQGFSAPCGLIRVDFTGPVPTKVIVHLAPGPVRGLLSAPMGQ